MTYSSTGIGIKLEGFPNSVKLFYWILSQQGCHPKATHRILQRISKNGYDNLTVMSLLNFDWIKMQLLNLNVNMSFIPALPNWYDKYSDGKWNDNDLPDKFKRN